MKNGLELFVAAISRPVLAAALAVLFMPSPAAGDEAPALKLSDRDGRVLEAVILGMANGEVELRRLSDGREFSVPLGSLSDTSQQQVKQFVAMPAKASQATPSQIDIDEPVLDHFKTRWQSLKPKLEGAVDPAELRMATTLLTDVLALERELIIAASPKDPATPIDWPEELDERTLDKVTQLRQSIRDKERASLLQRMGVDTGGKKSQSSQGDRERLHVLHDATLKPIKRALVKAQKALAKQTKSDFPIEQEVEALKNEVAGLQKVIDNLRHCFYGVDAEEWWCHDVCWPEDHTAEILRREISEARRVYHAALTEAANHHGENSYRMAEIDGVSFYSANFGVILDVSGSMMPHIEALKKDIDENFQSPLYREVQGCRLSVTEPNGRTKVTGFQDTMSCVEEMLLIYKVDTIYWFCDLNDTRSDEALSHLGELLRMSGARLYVRSMGRRPDGELKNLIDDI